MVVFDASALIAYLSGDDDAVAFIEARADEQTKTLPLVMFEVYQGEIFRPGPTDLDELESRLRWLAVVQTTQADARQSAEVQSRCHEAGEPLSPRDAFVAGTAARLNEPLAHRDDDFDNGALKDLIEIIHI